MDIACALMPYSLGEVTANKASGSWVIKAKLKQQRFAVEEEALTNPQQAIVEFDTGDGKAHIENTTDTSIEATWLPRDTNRITAPDVRRGDPVIIWKMGNEKYFWEERSIGNVKRLETVIWAFSSNPNEPLDRETLKNAYFFSISTHEKHMKLVTTKHNGEPFAYNIELNTAEGYYENKDDVGNRNYLNSGDRELGMVNADGSYVKVAQHNVEFKAIDDIVGTAGKDVAFECVTFRIKCNDFICDSDTAKFTGDTTVEGQTTTNGLSNTGDCSSSGGFETTSEIKGGRITATEGFVGNHI